MDEGQQTCVLVSTSHRYQGVAEFTLEMLDYSWSAHPQVFVCGINGTGRENWLESDTPNEDWLSITQSACCKLLSKNYKYAYLILDDHPPLARCHSTHLNKTLPMLLRDLSGTCIGLNGWGYGRDGRRIRGQILSSRYYRIEHIPKSFPWKFSLHPALWDLGKLADLLDILIRNLPLSQRTPWRFERLAGQPGLSLSFDYLDSAYRVCGRCMASSQIQSWRHYVTFLAARLVRFLAVRCGTKEQARRTTSRLDTIGQYYAGPYPLFWSGVVTAGRANKMLIDFLHLYGSKEFLASLNAQVYVGLQGKDLRTTPVT